MSESDRVAVIIPARYGSTRLPGKPLAVIAGKTMLERVWRIAASLKNVGRILIATDDERLVSEANRFGAQAVMTGECENGTERALVALERISEKFDVVVNFQGDAVLTPPWILQALIDEMLRDSEVQIATPAVRLNAEKYRQLAEAKKISPSAGTTVTFDRNSNALYFSKNLIPFVRNSSKDDPYVFRHIGLYAYRHAALERYVSLEPSPLERAEGLEQLRALENGMPIRVVEVDYRGRTHWSVDTPEDISHVEEIINREGELV